MPGGALETLAAANSALRVAIWTLTLDRPKPGIRFGTAPCMSLAARVANELDRGGWWWQARTLRAHIAREARSRVGPQAGAMPPRGGAPSPQHGGQA